MKKLGIKNYYKLCKRTLHQNWEVDYCQEMEYHYLICCINTDGVQRRIYLNRKGTILGSGQIGYFFYYNGRKTNTAVTADWISDIDNMVYALSGLIQVWKD